MAIVVVAGLTSSTVLTLLVIPVVDSLVHRITIPKKPKLEAA